MSLEAPAVTRGALCSFESEGGFVCGVARDPTQKPDVCEFCILPPKRGLRPWELLIAHPELVSAGIGPTHLAELRAYYISRRTTFDMGPSAPSEELDRILTRLAPNGRMGHQATGLTGEFLRYHHGLERSEVMVGVLKQIIRAEKSTFNASYTKGVPHEPCGQETNIFYFSHSMFLPLKLAEPYCSCCYCRFVPRGLPAEIEPLDYDGLGPYSAQAAANLKARLLCIQIAQGAESQAGDGVIAEATQDIVVFFEEHRHLLATAEGEMSNGLQPAEAVRQKIDVLSQKTPEELEELKYSTIFQLARFSIILEYLWEQWSRQLPGASWKVI